MWLVVCNVHVWRQVFSGHGSYWPPFGPRFGYIWIRQILGLMGLNVDLEQVVFITDFLFKKNFLPFYVCTGTKYCNAVLSDISSIILHEKVIFRGGWLDHKTEMKFSKCHQVLNVSNFCWTIQGLFNAMLLIILFMQGYYACHYWCKIDRCFFHITKFDGQVKTAGASSIVPHLVHTYM